MEETLKHEDGTRTIIQSVSDALSHNDKLVLFALWLGCSMVNDVISPPDCVCVRCTKKRLHTSASPLFVRLAPAVRHFQVDGDPASASRLHEVRHDQLDRRCSLETRAVLQVMWNFRSCGINSALLAGARAWPWCNEDALDD